MNINPTINPPSFTFDRSFYEAAMKLDQEDRLAFYDGLCKVAFERRMPEAQAEGTLDALDVALTLALPMVEQSCARSAGGARGGRPRKA